MNWVTLETTPVLIGEPDPRGAIVGRLIRVIVHPPLWPTRKAPSTGRPFSRYETRHWQGVTKRRAIVRAVVEKRDGVVFGGWCE